MKIKISIVILSIFISLNPVIASKRKFSQNMGERREFVDMESNLDMLTKGDKTGVVIFCPTVFALYYGENEYYQTQMFRNYDVQKLRFYIDYTSYNGSAVRFHYIIIGPEYEAYSTDWYRPKKNKYYYYYIEFNNPSFTKGLYKLVVFAETATLSAGLESSGECLFRVY
jgi:hypothetical protein